MKKANLILCILCFLIIAFGVGSLDFARGIGSGVVSFGRDVSQRGFFSAVESFAHNMESICTERLSYHDSFVDISSVLLRLAGVRVVEKSDSTVVRTDTDYLANPRPYIETERLEKRADKLGELMNTARDKGAEFLYVTAPTKGYAMEYPANVTDCTPSNCDRFFNLVEERDIPHLNLIDTFASRGKTEEDVFFVTDHHWRPEYAFQGAWDICARLEQDYGMEYDKALADISRYRVNTLEDWFLGSQGKKAGQYFTPLGVDDISIILPEFETHLTESQPAKGTLREGDFASTVMYMENVQTKDFYSLNPYAAYSGGDFREQITVNHKNPEGPRILLIRDSFSCAMAPFLSLATSELRCVDIRQGDMYVGDKIKASEYIDAMKPDYVIVMYTGVSSGDDLFDFE